MNSPAVNSRKFTAALAGYALVAVPAQTLAEVVMSRERHSKRGVDQQELCVSVTGEEQGEGVV